MEGVDVLALAQVPRETASITRQPVISEAKTTCA